NRLCSKIEQFLDRVLGNVAAPRNQAELAFERVFAAFQHFVGKIDAAVAGGFRTNQRTAPVQALAGKYARELVGESLILSKEEADLAATHSDVPRRNVSVCADVPPQLGHEALAETHHFVVAFALRVEVRATFAA